jgi:hypothetical protein
MRRTTIIAPALLALASVGYAADQMVAVRDFAIEPMGNLTNASGTLHIHPKAMISAATTDNVYASQNNAINDTVFSALAGLSLNYTATDALTIALDLEGRSDRYIDESDRNLDGGSGLLHVSWKGNIATAGLDVAYTRLDDPLVQTGERIQRENIDALARVGWEGVEYKGSFAFGGRSEQYLEDAGSFKADQRSNTGILTSFRVARQGGGDTEAYAAIRGSTWNYEKETLLNDGYEATPVVGWQSALGERTTMLLEGGFSLRWYDDVSAPGAKDDKVVLPIGTLVFSWDFADQSDIRIRGYCTADNSQTSNAYGVTGAQLATRFGITDQVIAFASVDGLHIEDTSSGTGVDAKVRNTGIVAGGAEYHAIRGLAFRLTGRYTDSTAVYDTGNDYHRTEVIFDTAFAF